MVFSSAVFLFIFLPAVFILYRLIPTLKYKNLFLALASIVFYAFGRIDYVLLFLASVCINYISGLLLMGKGTRRKLCLALCVVLNIGLLGVFKYTDFIITSLNAAFSLSIPTFGIPLPVGISFFTFQGLSYSIDVYRDPRSGTRDFRKLLLYISFFPQLVAGPIVKYHDVSAQIEERRCTSEQTAYGVRRCIFGLSKKLLIADTVGFIADKVFHEYLPGGVGDWRLMWLGAACYTLQIYFDFSGYSDMAIGMGRMFGFTFRENFDHPYGAASMKEFWRKWHISLSSWFKEYLYIPLGGNRKGRARTALNKFIVFFCTGIWHGANWTFVFWGLGHGLLTSLEDLGVIPAEKLGRSALGRVVGKVYTLFSVMLLFVFFNSDSFSSAFRLIALMFTGRPDAYSGFLLRSLLTPAACFVLLLAVLLAGNLPGRLKALVSGSRAAGSAALQLLGYTGLLLLYLLCVMCLARGGFNPFIYFQF